MKLFIATAATKKQLANAELVFGKTGEKVVAGLEVLNKAFKHPEISNFLEFLRGSEEVVEKWASSKSGVKAIENLKIAGTSKSVEKVLEAVTSIKAIPRQDKGILPPKGIRLDGPPKRNKDDKPTYFGSYRPSVPVPSSEKAKPTKVKKVKLPTPPPRSVPEPNSPEAFRALVLDYGLYGQRRDLRYGFREHFGTELANTRGRGGQSSVDRKSFLGIFFTNTKDEQVHLAYKPEALVREKFALKVNGEYVVFTVKDGVATSAKSFKNYPSALKEFLKRNK